MELNLTKIVLNVLNIGYLHILQRTKKMNFSTMIGETIYKFNNI